MNEKLGLTPPNPPGYLGKGPKSIFTNASLKKTKVFGGLEFRFVVKLRETQ